MKTKLLLVLLFASIGASAQTTNIQLSILGGVDWNDSEYTFPGGIVDESKSVQVPLGNTLAVRARIKANDKLHFTTGIQYSKKTFYPRLILGGFYGSLQITDPQDSLRVIFNPYLAEHSFKLVQIPLYIQYSFKETGLLQPYLSIGFMGQARFKEQESFQEAFSSPEETEDSRLSVTEKGLSFFGLSFDMGLGVKIAISDRIGILLEQQASIWEYRAENQKFKQNGELLYDTKIRSFSRLSLNAGVEYQF